MNDRNKTEVANPLTKVANPLTKVLFPSPKAQRREEARSGRNAKEYMFKITDKLREYQEKVQLDQEYLKQKNEMILQYQEREEKLSDALQETKQLLLDLQNEIAQKNKAINQFQESEKRIEQLQKEGRVLTEKIKDLESELEVSQENERQLLDQLNHKKVEIHQLTEEKEEELNTYVEEKEGWKEKKQLLVSQEIELRQGMEKLAMELQVVRDNLKNRDQVIQHHKESALKNEQALKQKEQVIQEFQARQRESDQRIKELQVIEEREPRLNQMIHLLQSSEARATHVLIEHQQMITEREHTISTLEQNEQKLKEQLHAKEKILTGLKKQEYTCLQDMENLKAELQLQLQEKDEEVRRMSNRKSWFNWFGSEDEKGNRQSETQLLLEQERTNHQELENVKKQLRNIMDRLDSAGEAEKMQGELIQTELNMELQSLKAKAAGWQQLIEQQEQEIQSLKDREKSYLQKIQQFTTNLQMMQQRSNATATPQSSAGMNQIPTGNNSPFFKDHKVPPRPEDYFQN